jgi:hypothetical protein
MIKQGMCGLKLMKKTSNKPFLGTTGLNVVINNPELVAEVVSSTICDDLTQLFTEQFNLYRCQDAQQCKIFRTNSIDGTSQKAHIG